MNFYSLALIFSPAVSGTLRELFPRLGEDVQAPRDVVPGCYGGRLDLDASQLFFDTDRFAWIVEVSVGVPNMETLNLYMNRIDPTETYQDDESVCMAEVVKVERDAASGFVEELKLSTSDCLKDMGVYIMAEEETKLENLILTWLPSRYVFGLSAMALLPKAGCEYLDVEVGPQESLVAITAAPEEVVFVAPTEAPSREDVAARMAAFSAFVDSLEQELLEAGAAVYEDE